MKAYIKTLFILSFLSPFLLISISHSHVNAQDFLKKYLSNSSIKSGKQLKADGDYPSAIKAFTKSIKKEPKNLEAHYQLGLIFEEVLYDYDKAISLYKNVIRLSDGIKSVGTDVELKEFNALLTNARVSIDNAIKKKFEFIEKPKVPIYIMVEPYQKILKEPKMFSTSKYKTTSYASEFKLLDFRDNWYQIYVPSIGSGWINGKNVLKITQKKQKAIETSLAGKAALYQRFVDLYPDSSFAQNAKDKADDIYYSLAKEEGSIDSYSMYLRKYSDGKHAKVARLQLDTLAFHDEGFFNNINRLRHWITNNPESTFIEKAKKRIDELAFAQAKYDNNTLSLEGYLIDYPGGKFVSEAKQLLEGIKYNQAKFIDTVVSYRKYFDEYPDGKYVDDATKRIDEKEFSTLLGNQDIELLVENLKNATNEEHIELVKNRIEELYFKKEDGTNNDIEAIKNYEDYLQRYPDGKFVQQAKKRIAEFAFAGAKAKDTINAYKEFTTEYPNSHLVITAKNIIETGYFKNASLKGTVKSYKEYVELYPDGSHLGEARLIIDKLTFEPYKEKGSVSGFEKFIKKYPDNRYVNEAKQKIILLQTSNIGEESDSDFPYLLMIIISSGVGIAIAGVLMRKRVVSMVQSWQQGDWSCECGTKHNKELEDCSACGNTRPKFNRASLIGYAKWLREKPYAMYGKIPEKEVIAQKTKDIQAKAINTFDKIKEYHDKLEKERKEKYQTIIDTNECSQGKKSSSKVEFDKPVVTTSINSPPPSTSGFISKADKMGFPRFYKNVSGEGGLTWEAILEDYGECLYPGKGFSNSCLAAIDPILCILKKGPSQNDNIKCWKFREALGQRLSEINEGFKLIADVPMHTQNPSVTDGRNQESLVLYLIDRYLALFTNFTKTYDGKEMKNDKEEMDWAIDELTKLLDYCSRLEQSSCESLKKRIQMGIDRHKELVGNFSDFAKQQPIQASTTPPPTPTSDSIMEENMYKFKNHIAEEKFIECLERVNTGETTYSQEYEVLQEIMELEPDIEEPGFFYMYGCAFEGEGEVENALSAYMRALETEKKYQTFEHNKALGHQVYKQLGLCALKKEGWDILDEVGDTTDKLSVYNMLTRYFQKALDYWYDPEDESCGLIKELIRRIESNIANG